MVTAALPLTFLHDLSNSDQRLVSACRVPSSERSGLGVRPVAPPGDHFEPKFVVLLNAARRAVATAESLFHPTVGEHHAFAGSPPQNAGPLRVDPGVRRVDSVELPRALNELRDSVRHLLLSLDVCNGFLISDLMRDINPHLAFSVSFLTSPKKHPLYARPWKQRRLAGGEEEGNDVKT
jgi:hypothetical protein